jgi:hypothetical protein
MIKGGHPDESLIMKIIHVLHEFIVFGGMSQNAKITTYCDIKLIIQVMNEWLIKMQSEDFRGDDSAFFCHVNPYPK